VIPEPQRAYVLELLKALGPIAQDFVVVGAQAMKFMLDKTRGTKDIDFVLDIVHLRGESQSVGDTLAALGYAVVKESRNFQFEKPIPGSHEVMRLEFMAPEEFKRAKDFRVDVDKDVHARFCTGGSIAVAESSLHPLSGKLPDGSTYAASVRVTNPHALVMLKLLALDDRYYNPRGQKHARHDREEARSHAADIIAIISGQIDLLKFKENFENQFLQDPLLGVRVLKILESCFREDTSPGLLVYEEFIVADKPIDPSARKQVAREIARAREMMTNISPPREFYEMAAAVADSCDLDGNRGLVEEFLTNLKQARIKITDRVALDLIPSMVFGGAYRKFDKVLSSAEVLKSLSAAEVQLLLSHLQFCAGLLRGAPELMERFRIAMD